MRSRRPWIRKNLATDELPRHLVTVEDPTGVASEAYRAMRTNLFYTLADPPPRVIVLTSPGPKEGKSSACANLGVVLAQAGKHTLVMDCHLRQAGLHKLFGLRNTRGIANVLVRQHNLREVLQEPLPNLKVATTGPVPHNPTELFSSTKLAELLGQARQEFDYVLIDAPHLLIDSSPVGHSADPVILAAQADGVLLVLDAHSTRKEALPQAMRTLKTVGANVIGTVLNNVEGARRR